MQRTLRQYRPLAVVFSIGLFYFIVTFFSFGRNLPTPVRDDRFPDTFTLSGDDFLIDIDSTKPDDLFLNLRVEPPGQTIADANASITITEFGFNDADEKFASADEVCLDSLYMPPSKEIYFSSYEYVKQLPECYKEDNGEGIGYPITPIPTGKLVKNRFSLRPETFWYPYDHVNMKVSFIAEYHVVKNGKTIYSGRTAPLLQVTGNLLNKDWEISTKLAPNEAGDHLALTENYLVITLNRPIIYRILCPLLFFVFVFLIGLLTIENTLFLDGSIATFLGIIGIRQLLIPSSIDNRIFVDILLLGLYLLLIIPIGMHIYRSLAQARVAEQAEQHGKAKLQQKNDELLKSLIEAPQPVPKKRL